MKVRLVLAWYDLWIGAYYDRAQRRLYVFPVPCLGVVFELREKQHQRWSMEVCTECGGALGDLEGRRPHPRWPVCSCQSYTFKVGFS